MAAFFANVAVAFSETPARNNVVSPESYAQDVGQTPTDDARTSQEIPAQAAPAPAPPSWQYGGFLDAAYLLDFNHPANDLFRSRGTTYKVDYPILNMAAAMCRRALPIRPAGECS
jgi:hypothetical protein